MTPIQKAKEIIISYYEHAFGVKFVAIGSINNWLETPEAQALLSGEDWVSVEDRLPEYDKKVLVFGEQRGMNPQMGGAYISISSRIDLKGTLLEHQQSRHVDAHQFKHMSYVTHWRPLPEPPKIN